MNTNAACSLDQLATRTCVPCARGVPALARAAAEAALKVLPGWSLAADAKSIRKEWVMKDFAAAVDLVCDIKASAEAEGHHPDLHLTRYRRLSVILYTHAIGGLSDNDLILAAKIEKLPKRLQRKKG